MQDVTTKQTASCAKLVHLATLTVWEDREAIAAEEARLREQARGGDEERQRQAAFLAQTEAVKERPPLVWEVFDAPGRRWRSRWRLALALPDGQRDPAQIAEAIANGDLVVEPVDTPTTIERKLDALRGKRPATV